jgi:hypothetical protein
LHLDEKTFCIDEVNAELLEVSDVSFEAIQTHDSKLSTTLNTLLVRTEDLVAKELHERTPLRNWRMRRTRRRVRI